MDDILKQIISFVPLITKLIPVDCGVAVSDRETILCCHSNLQNLQIDTFSNQEGAPVSVNSPMGECMQKDRVLHTSIPKEMVGMPFHSTAIPLKNSQGMIVGSILLVLAWKIN